MRSEVRGFRKCGGMKNKHDPQSEAVGLFCRRHTTETILRTKTQNVVSFDQEPKCHEGCSESR